MKRWLIPVVAVLVIAVGVGCFFGGRATRSGSTANAKNGVFANGFPGANGQTPQGGNGTRGGGGMVIGSIISNDGTSITVKTQDGSTKIVLFSGSTTISKSTTGSASDLTVGQDVRVTGETKSDGTVSATGISVGKQQGMPTGMGRTTTTAKS